MNTDWWNALLGGAMIGIAVSFMLLATGRVTGISGILGQALVSKPSESFWRYFFVIGLLCGGLVLSFFRPDSFQGQLGSPLWSLALAGLLVGVGTSIGSGCTSGHGVCGISRLSLRSILATLVFIASGIAAAAALRVFMGFPQ